MQIKIKEGLRLDPDMYTVLSVDHASSAVVGNCFTQIPHQAHHVDKYISDCVCKEKKNNYHNSRRWRSEPAG
jgi:hypothetical protein